MIKLKDIDKTNRRTMVQSLRDFKVGAEVGVCGGMYSKFILDNTAMKLYSIDPWEVNSELAKPKEIFAKCKLLLEPYGDRVEMVKGYSPDISSMFEDESFDFVYIDALHDYDSVKSDMEAWWEKVKVGGVMAGHDYNSDKWYGVVRAVTEFSREEGIEVSLTGIVGNAKESRTGDIDEFDGNEQSWFFIKE